MESGRLQAVPTPIIKINLRRKTQREVITGECERFSPRQLASYRFIGENKNAKERVDLAGGGIKR